MFRYTALRFGLIVASFGVIWGLVRLRILPAGLGDSNYLWVGLLALIVSAPLSWVLLRGAREQAALKVSNRVERTRLNLAANLAANASQEDEADDAAREVAARGASAGDSGAGGGDDAAPEVAAGDDEARDDADGDDEASEVAAPEERAPAVAAREEPVREDTARTP